MTKAIGFDFDGVILDSEPFKAKAFADLLARRFKFRPDRARFIWKVNAGLSRRDKFAIAYEEIFGRTLTENGYQTLDREFSRSLIRDYHKASVTRDMKRVLAYAQEQFDYVFISTGTPDNEVKRLVEMYDITQFFDDVMGTGTEYLSKLQHFAVVTDRIKPEVLVFVADGVEDMKIAKLFGAYAVGVEGLFTSSDLGRAGADTSCTRQTLLKTLQDLRL